MEKTTVATAYWVSLVTTVNGLSINEWVAVGGLMIGVATFCTNLWFKHEHLKLARENVKAGE